MIEMAKNPKLFAKLAEQQQKTLEEQKQERFNKGMAQVAESKKNMKIDLRPKVVIRAMRYELLFFAFGFTFVFGLPLYFYKVKPILEE
jgi:hypothetical protein